MSDLDKREVIREIIEKAYNEGNYEVLRQKYTPDFIEHQFGRQPTIEGMEEDIRKLRSSFPDFKLTIEEMAEDGDKVWIRMTGRGTNKVGFMGPPNGRSFEIAVFDIARFENGRIVEHWGSPDRFALLIQLGLLPQKMEPEAEG